MSKYVKPAQTKETSLIDKITDSAEKTGAQFIDTVESTCTELASAMVSTVEGMIQSAIDQAVGLYNSVTDAINSVTATGEELYDSTTKKFDELYSSASETIAEGDEAIRDALDEVNDDLSENEKTVENGNIQATALKPANDEVSNMSAKDVKQLSEQKSLVTSTASKLSQTGVTAVKSTLLKK